MNHSPFGKDDRHSASWPDTGRRVISIIVGSGYIGLVSLPISAATESSLLITAPIVAACAAIEMLIIGELSRRLFLNTDAGKRFGLGTLFLVVTGLSIYLSAIGAVIQSLQANDGDLPAFVILILGIYATLFIAISTIVLTYFAEALVWAGLSTATAMGIRRKKRS